MLGIKHLRTRPHRPQTNGKAERFIRTLLAGWAYGPIYGSSHERTRALDGWLWHYNHQRRHTALGHQPPISRTNLLGSPVSSFCQAGTGRFRSEASSFCWATVEVVVMAAAAKRIEVGVEDRLELEGLVRSRKAERRAVERARIVLAASEGKPAAMIANELGCSERTVWKWRARFGADGLGAPRCPRRGGRSCMARLSALADRARVAPAAGDGRGLRRTRAGRIKNSLSRSG
jgi:hypothetical protein